MCAEYTENFNKNIIENEIFKIEHQDHLFVYFKIIKIILLGRKRYRILNVTYKLRLNPGRI